MSVNDQRPVRWRAGETQVTGRDRTLLRFMAEHRLLLTDHAAALLGISAPAAQARLRALAKAGFVQTRVLFHRRPAFHQITRQGLALVGSELPPPRMDVRGYDHDVGVA